MPGTLQAGAIGIAAEETRQNKATNAHRIVLVERCLVTGALDSLLELLQHEQPVAFALQERELCMHLRWTRVEGRCVEEQCVGSVKHPVSVNV